MDWDSDSSYSGGLLERWGDDNHKAPRGGLREGVSASQWQWLLGWVCRMDVVVVGAKGGHRQGLGKSHGI